MKTSGNNQQVESSKQFPEEYSLILNFPEKKKSFSLKVPSNWTVYRLKKFVFSEFIEEIRSPKPILLFQANPLYNTYNDKLLSSIFKENVVNFLLVLVKKEKKENEVNRDKKESEKERDLSSFYFKTKGEILASDEFSYVEEGVFKAYSKVIQSKNKNKNETPLQKFPLMHYAVNQRIEAINKKDALLSLSSFEPGRLEYYPLREYFNFNLILRLLLTFIIFNLSNHLYKFIFLLFLIGYYWYSMYILVDAFYEKKKEEIRLSEDELKEIKSVFSSVEIEKKIDLLINQKDKQINIELTNQNEENQNDEKENDPKNIDLGANPNRFVGGQNLRMFLNQKGNNIRNQVFANEMKGIEHLLEKKDKEQQSENNINNVNNEQQLIRIFRIIGKCLYLLFITLIPNWTDEFERENPFPNERNAQNNNNNDDNNENNNNNNNEMNEINNNQNIENNNIIHNENENSNININNANINNEIENLIEHHDNEDKNNTEDMKNGTSSKDVNLSEDLSKEPRHKIFNKKSHFDSGNKKETEFVFSDHENIDNLSNEDDTNIIHEAKDAES